VVQWAEWLVYAELYYFTASIYPLIVLVDFSCVFGTAKLCTATELVLIHGINAIQNYPDSGETILKR